MINDLSSAHPQISQRREPLSESLLLCASASVLTKWPSSGVSEASGAGSTERRGLPESGEWRYCLSCTLCVVSSSISRAERMAHAVEVECDIVGEYLSTEQLQ